MPSLVVTPRPTVAGRELMDQEMERMEEDT